MRTEQEIRDRIAEMETAMRGAITNYYKNEWTEEFFAKMYSDIWDNMRELHWALGMTQREATDVVAAKVMRMSDEIRAAIENKQ